LGLKLRAFGKTHRSHGTRWTICRPRCRADSILCVRVQEFGNAPRWPLKQGKRRGSANSASITIQWCVSSVGKDRQTRPAAFHRAFAACRRLCPSPWPPPTRHTSARGSARILTASGHPAASPDIAPLSKHVHTRSASLHPPCCESKETRRSVSKWIFCNQSAKPPKQEQKPGFE
jgi:hypothetical protein